MGRRRDGGGRRSATGCAATASSRWRRRSAVTALQHALDRDESVLTVVDMEWQRFVLAFTSGRSRPLLYDLPEARDVIQDMAGRRHRRRTARAPVRRWPSSSPGLPEAEQERLVLELVRTAVAAVLGYCGRRRRSRRAGPSRSWASTRSPPSSCATGSAPPAG
ncbi:beta-ketoacyl reductase [Streptomyces sp. Mo3]|uniref:acyl carrier protein n=1 Tax=Streptomyces sp. Mo3 TaxID=3161190 RepID=UPI0039F0594D